MSRRETARRIESAGEDWRSLDAIVITHEHSDHVCGLARMVRALRAEGRQIPIFVSRMTALAIDWEGLDVVVETFQAGLGFTIGDIEVSSFSIPHDAIDPVGFTFRAEGVKLGVVTDLGYMPESICYHLRGTDFLLLESNHDLDMLKVGPYPWSLKQRVMGRRGHLSNEVVSTFIRASMDSSTATLVLGHLSEHNNHPEIVRLVAEQALGSRSLNTRLVIADPSKQAEVFLF